MSSIKKVFCMLLTRQNIYQIISFSIVWCIGTWLNLGATYVLTEYIGFRYIASNFIWQVIGITNNFFMNKRFTFKNTTWSTKKQYMFSFIIYWFSTILSLFMIYLLTDRLGIWYVYSILLVIPITIFINFLWHKFIVFKK